MRGVHIELTNLLSSFGVHNSSRKLGSLIQTVDRSNRWLPIFIPCSYCFSNNGWLKMKNVSASYILFRSSYVWNWNKNNTIPFDKCWWIHSFPPCLDKLVHVGLAYFGSNYATNNGELPICRTFLQFFIGDFYFLNRSCPFIQLHYKWRTLTYLDIFIFVLHHGCLCHYHISPSWGAGFACDYNWRCNQGA